MRQLITFAVLGFSLALAQPAFSCPGEKGASCENCKECKGGKVAKGDSCPHHKGGKNDKQACGCKHGAEKAAPAPVETEKKPTT